MAISVKTSVVLLIFLCGMYYHGLLCGCGRNNFREEDVVVIRMQDTNEDQTEEESCGKPNQMSAEIIVEASDDTEVQEENMNDKKTLSDSSQDGRYDSFWKPSRDIKQRRASGRQHYHLNLKGFIENEN
ncbi:hypothetical protein RF11_10958 [Thelohanellus kitauei]|uniref:Uncharacterized protein n=1 Tax=Thelohanellus kitauei TaxID=669202 RepID=A0A0C2M8U3_THEKT|nr:hypothetical protein RF11_10958 [Thelohanellus kitauei]